MVRQPQSLSFQEWDQVDADNEVVVLLASVRGFASVFIARWHDLQPSRLE